MMEKILKLIPTIALVSVIGIALANNQGQQNPCTVRGTQGYVKTNLSNPNPTLSPADEILAGNMNDVGQYDADFNCVNVSPECHWVYSPGHAQANPDGWIKCQGEFQEL